MLGMKQNWGPISSENQCHALGQGEKLFFNNSFLPGWTMKLSLDFTMKVKLLASINKTTRLTTTALHWEEKKSQKTENRINQVYHFDFFPLPLLKIIWGTEIAFALLVTTSLLICWCYFSVSKSMHGEESCLHFVLKSSLFLTGIIWELLCRKEATDICPWEEILTQRNSLPLSDSLWLRNLNAFVLSLLQYEVWPRIKISDQK